MGAIESLKNFVNRSTTPSNPSPPLTTSPGTALIPGGQPPTQADLANAIVARILGSVNRAQLDGPSALEPPKSSLDFYLRMGVAPPKLAGYSTFLSPIGGRCDTVYSEQSLFATGSLETIQDCLERYTRDVALATLRPVFQQIPGGGSISGTITAPVGSGFRGGVPYLEVWTSQATQTTGLSPGVFNLTVTANNVENAPGAAATAFGTFPFYAPNGEHRTLWFPNSNSTGLPRSTPCAWTQTVFGVENDQISWTITGTPGSGAVVRLPVPKDDLTKLMKLFFQNVSKYGMEEDVEKVAQLLNAMRIREMLTNVIAS